MLLHCKTLLPPRGWQGLPPAGHLAGGRQQGLGLLDEAKTMYSSPIQLHPFKDASMSENKRERMGIVNKWLPGKICPKQGCARPCKSVQTGCCMDDCRDEAHNSSGPKGKQYHLYTALRRDLFQPLDVFIFPMPRFLQGDVWSSMLSLALTLFKGKIGSLWALLEWLHISRLICSALAAPAITMSAGQRGL